MMYKLSVAALLAAASADHYAWSTCKDLKSAYSASSCCSSNGGYAAKATNYTVKAGQCYESCTTEELDFPCADIAEKNKVFDQLTVAEQLSIEDLMKPFGVSFEAWNKCATLNCSTIAKLALVKPPKAQVLAYMAGGPKPKRIASFWWLRGDQRPRVAEQHTVEMPITSTSVPTLVKTVPWEARPFVTWEDTPFNKRSELMDPLKPIFDPMLATIVPSSSMLAKAAELGVDFSTRVSWSGGGHNVPGSTPSLRAYFGRVDVRTNVGPNYFKEGPMQYTMTYDWDTDTLRIFDIVFCPGKGNPTFESPAALLDAWNAGTLKYCEIDGPWYGDTKASMEPEGPYYIREAEATRVGAVVSYPEGSRVTVHGRTVSWMGWDFHADIHAINGMHISNLRFRGERIAYELYAVDFTAVYSGASSRKDIFYSDGGYEMGNCATTLRVGLQCPEGSKFMYSLGYDKTYVWGNALAADHEAPTMCVFEGPANDILFQHAKFEYEGLPATSLYVRDVLTVGNYDYIQTFRADLDGSFHFGKFLSGYAVGGYMLPDDPSSEKMADFFGAKVSQSSYGALHTHSASTKIDLDIAGLENSFKIKKPLLGDIDTLLTETGIDKTGIAYQSPTSYYFDSNYITSEGNWDNDGDSTWTPPAGCIQAKTSELYLVESEATTGLGNKRGWQLDIPVMSPNLLPEHNKFLHLQNFTKCNLAVTKYNPADESAVPPEVFGALYPLPAQPGNDISHFFNDESLEKVDLVFYIANTKYHYVRTEDLPVPTSMGKYLSFEPFNYFTDDVGTFKHLPKSMYRYDQKIGPATRDGIPVQTCAS